MLSDTNTLVIYSEYIVISDNHSCYTVRYDHLCVARVCCALLCSARVLSSVSRKRQTCRQAPSQDIRQAKSFADWEAAKFWSKVLCLAE
jgi:hypothetical protein